MDTSGTQAIDRGLNVLELVSEAPITVRQLTERTNLPRTTVTRLLGALERFGYVARRDDGAYHLGSRALKLAGQWHRQFGIEEAARPHLEELVSTVQETVHVVAREGLFSVCVSCIESPRSIRLTLSVGDRAPLHAGSHAKTLLAFASPKLLDAVEAAGLRALTAETIVDPQTLREEIARIKQQGFAESFGEVDADAYGLAAPVRSVAGAVVATVGASGPMDRMLPFRETARTAVIQAAEAISRDLGYTGVPPSTA